MDRFKEDLDRWLTREPDNGPCLCERLPIDECSVCGNCFDCCPCEKADTQ